MQHLDISTPFFRWARGIALIDILMALVIIMILIIASVLYWQSNQRANLTQAGYDLLQDIIEAAQGWQPVHVNQGKYSGISVNGLLREGNIPEQYITDFNAQSRRFSRITSRLPIDQHTGLTTPWAGDSKVFVTQAEQGVLKIVFDQIPNYACESLTNRVNQGSMLSHPGASISNTNRAVPNVDSAKCRDNEDNSARFTMWYHPDM